jgi:hypothetical protein
MMRRFVAFIAVLFTLSAVLGGTVAHAHRYVSTPIVVLNHVDDANRSIPVVVEIQRGQIDLGDGIVMPCGPHQAIAISLPAFARTVACSLPEIATRTSFTPWSRHQLLRPPISA